MKLLFAVLRFVAGVATGVAIVATFAAAEQPVNLFNFFGFFTIQGNIICALVFIVAAAFTFGGHAQSRGLVFARACATTYIVIVGVVYNTLLAGTAGGVAVPWANTVLHSVIPLYAAIDWIFFGDRTPIPWRRFWLVLVYPLVWIIVVLARGGTDGWVPYPFLAPTHGYGMVALYCLAIAIAFAGAGALVWWVSRYRLLKP
ncbi:Pr6Pr family membrane protein [soil metagenome]